MYFLFNVITPYPIVHNTNGIIKTAQLNEKSKISLLLNNNSIPITI